MDLFLIGIVFIVVVLLLIIVLGLTSSEKEGNIKDFPSKYPEQKVCSWTADEQEIIFFVRSESLVIVVVAGYDIKEKINCISNCVIVNKMEK